MARKKAEKEKIATITQELTRPTGDFYVEYLGDDCKQLCQEVILHRD